MIEMIINLNWQKTYIKRKELCVYDAHKKTKVTEIKHLTYKSSLKYSCIFPWPVFFSFWHFKNLYIYK